MSGLERPGVGGSRPLHGRVAVVTGASRGVGKGIAEGLGEAGATVYVTGRTVEAGRAVGGLPGSIGETAELVTRLGGRGLAVRCDHRDDAQVEALFRRIEDEQGRLDLLVNNAWGGYERFYDGTPFNPGPFWEQPRSLWDAMHVSGVRAHYVASCLAAPLLIASPAGLVVFVSSYAGRAFVPPVAYGVAHAAIDRMAADMAVELRPHGVAAVSLYPGLVRTEAVLRAAEHFDLSSSESPRFVGRAVAALAADPERMRHSGRAHVAAELADEYGFRDVDGRRPRPPWAPDDG